jgi:hypothetical protein
MTFPAYWRPKMTEDELRRDLESQKRRAEADRLLTVARRVTALHVAGNRKAPDIAARGSDFGGNLAFRAPS